MQDDYSCQTLPPKPDQIDLKLEDIIDPEDENTDGASPSARMKFRSVMTQREMEILTSWFPKAARTLVGVLRRLPR
jgi:hypothetical protein